MTVARLFLFLVAFAAGAALHAGEQRMWLHYQGELRSYLLYLPDDLDAGQANALVLVLHGRNGTAQRMASLTGFNERAERHGFIVAYPDSFGGRWNYLHGIPGAPPGPDDPGFLIALTDALTGTHNIDPGKRYITGISNGGFMAQRMACDGRVRFAAFASVAASGYAALPGNCHRPEPVDALFLHGTADQLLPWEGRGIEYDGGERQLVTLSMKQTLKFWSRSNVCAGSLEVSEIAPSGRSQGTRVRVFSTRDCKAGAQVKLYAIIGGGHNWPGVADRIRADIAGQVNLDIHASDVVWSFFDRRQR